MDSIIELAGHAEAELLRRKYRVKRDGAELQVGLGEWLDLVRATVIESDLGKSTMEFCDEVDEAFNAYLDDLTAKELAAHKEGDEKLRTTAAVIRQAFVESRSERLRKEAKGLR